LTGLLLKLNKLRQSAPGIGGKTSDFVVIGYYDMLEITEVNALGEFSPEFERDFLPGAEFYSHEVLIKLVKPKSAALLEERYNEIISFSQGDIGHSRFNGKPLLTIALLRYTKEKIAATKYIDCLIKETSEKIAQIITEMDLQPSDKPIFAVYPTIGFMDAAVVCRSNGFSKIVKAIFDLRAVPDFLAGCYMVPCAYMDEFNKGNEAWKCLAVDDDSYMSFNATLMPGIGSNQYYLACKKELTSIGAYQPRAFYETFGGSDVLSLPEKPLSALMPLFTPNANRLFQPPFKNLLASSQTSVRIRGTEPLEDGADSNASAPEEPRSLEKDFREMLKEQRSARNKLITDRLIEGLHNMVCFYFDLTQSRHSFDIRANVDPALDALLRGIGIIGKMDTQEYISAEFYENLSVFRDAATDLINDYARASRHMFEGRWLKHPSIASSNKLMLAYHLFLRDTIQNYSGDSTYTFLTVSGGVDSVVADALFPFVKPEESGREDRLIILRLPEASLFSPAETLFHMHHEAFHFLGNRKRALRSECMYKSMAAYIADSFYWEFWATEAPFLTRLKEKLSKSRRQDLIQALDEKQSENAEKFRNETYKRLLDILKPESNEQYYSTWKVSAFKIFACKIDEIESVSREECRKCLHEFVIACLLDNPVGLGDSSSICSDILVIHTQYFNERFEVLKSDASEGIDRMLGYIGNAYQEGFSDLCSVLLLDSQQSDYLNTFSKGDWRKKDTDATKSVFRISSVVQACFSEESGQPHTGVPEFDVFLERFFAKAREHERVLAPLVEYLRACKDTFIQSLTKMENLTVIRELYRKAQNGLDEGALDMLLQRWMAAAQEDYG
jgi:hypothetical protein